MRAFKDRARLAQSLALVLCGILIGMTLIGVGAVAQTGSAVKAKTASAPVAQTACRHIIGSHDPHEPCIVGDILLECGYSPGSCEYNKYLHCKMSGELGEEAAVGGNPEKGFIVKHPHKRVTCQGSATILRVYAVKGRHIPYVYQAVSTSTHFLTATVHGYYAGSTLFGELLVVMAQR